MIIFQYDKTFEGLLTAVFEAYRLKKFPDSIIKEGDTLPLFYDETYTVITDDEKAERVWKSLEKKLSKGALSMLTYSWLSEASDIAIVLFRYIRKITDASRSIETNFADPDILTISKLGKKVADERYRILQFMRFQKTTEGIYYGAMEPLYDVFPLTIRHFRDRFADQKWLIYDVKRHYGYYYDGKEVNEITFADPKQTHLQTGKLDESLLDKNEKLFQTLWKSYFKSICIKERLNPVKHKKDMSRNRFTCTAAMLLFYYLTESLYSKFTSSHFHQCTNYGTNHITQETGGLNSEYPFIFPYLFPTCMHDTAIVCLYICMQFTEAGKICILKQNLCCLIHLIKIQ